MYKNAKVYCDGNAYIAIPHTTGTRRRAPRQEEMIRIKEEIRVDENGVIIGASKSLKKPKNEQNQEVNRNVSCEEKTPVKTVTIERFVPKKSLFDKYYSESVELPRAERKAYVFDKLEPYAEPEGLKTYIDEGFDRKIRNLISKRKRMVRKAYLYGTWNYFVTFTYDDEKHTEDSFREKLSAFLKNNAYRKDWKYIGVWERGEERDRLHFHGVFDIPKGSMPGELIEVEDYDFKTHKMRIIHPCVPISKKFGRNDFEEIDKNDLSRALGYLVKYLEKSGEKIVYSRGLPEYRISDIQDDDVICPAGKYEDKLVLFDDFTCISNGVPIGKCSYDNLKKLPYSNF